MNECQRLDQLFWSEEHFLLIQTDRVLGRIYVYICFASCCRELSLTGQMLWTESSLDEWEDTNLSELG